MRGDGGPPSGPAGPAASRSRAGLLRELGEQAVLEAIFRHGPVTRPTIASLTSLSKPTVSTAVGRLEQAGLVRADGIRPGARGRRPIAYRVSDRAGYVVGCDIGGTNLRVATADLFGAPLHDLQAPTSRDGGAAVGAQMVALIDAVVERTDPDYGRPLALGVSVPGVVEHATGAVSLAHNVAPEGDFRPLELLRGSFAAPARVENNVNLAAVGERWFGLARGVSTMVFVGIGAGIGMGIIIDDVLVRGAHGAAGEIGYLPLVGDPFDPRHRLQGGLEAEVAAAGILAAYAGRRGPSVPGITDVQEVFERATAGDGDARAVIKHVAERLGAAIATTCAILDPELVVLGGGIGANPLLLRPVRGATAQLVPITARIETTVLGDRAALQGAVAVALQVAREELLVQAGRTRPGAATGHIKR